jgi:hypothetical protein
MYIHVSTIIYFNKAQFVITYPANNIFRLYYIFCCCISLENFAVVIILTVFWDILPSGLLKVRWHSRDSASHLLTNKLLVQFEVLTAVIMNILSSGI